MYCPTLARDCVLQKSDGLLTPDGDVLGLQTRLRLRGHRAGNTARPRQHVVTPPNNGTGTQSHTPTMSQQAHQRCMITRGYHSSTFRLNVSTLLKIRWVVSQTKRYVGWFHRQKRLGLSRELNEWQPLVMPPHNEDGEGGQQVGGVHALVGGRGGGDEEVRRVRWCQPEQRRRRRAAGPLTTRTRAEIGSAA